ncbi:DUF5908 family protein [Aquimarina pacifica]|uniref:DUF5908 family protein n=1 Tax=Aquimarina pacifica TaxID=1296415 RepID=UPI0004BAB397|nr:DUF5908 family protein [Aquimarina pacifica]
MPIEIKELHIKINVDETKNQSQGATSSGQKGNAELIANCVERVMEILETKNER